MNNVTWAGASACRNCKRMVPHKPHGGPHKWHGCRLRWIVRRIARARSEGFDDGYAFALRNISDPMVYADLAEYGTGWAGLIEQGGLTIEAAEVNAGQRSSFRDGADDAPDEAKGAVCPHPPASAAVHECVFVEEQEPSGRLILPPCIECGLTAMDALEQLRGER